ncbi:DUF2188 domain-containing protein [Rhodocista pekingensis]|uniref:DUF2188 domain-containing protein n=1 Tax=Rhodocista pekingensis TaxID=201185 RepID=A0ABW2KU32_9PROT
MKNAHHVIPSADGSWNVRRSGAVRASRRFDSQADAIRYATDKARKAQGELYIHRRDGVVVGRDSFGPAR